MVKTAMRDKSTLSTSRGRFWADLYANIRIVEEDLKNVRAEFIKSQGMQKTSEPVRKFRGWQDAQMDEKSAKTAEENSGECLIELSMMFFVLILMFSFEVGVGTAKGNSMKPPKGFLLLKNRFRPTCKR
jgi:hypothetical protein